MLMNIDGLCTGEKGPSCVETRTGRKNLQLVSVQKPIHTLKFNQLAHPFIFVTVLDPNLQLAHLFALVLALVLVLVLNHQLAHLFTHDLILLFVIPQVIHILRPLITQINYPKQNHLRFCAYLVTHERESAPSQKVSELSVCLFWNYHQSVLFFFWYPLMADPAHNKKKKRTKTSPVWRYFEESENAGKVRCTLCSDVYELVYSSSTSNLLYHLKTQHSREYRQLQEEDLAGPPLTETNSDTRNRSHSVPTPQPKISEFTPLTGEKKRTSGPH